ncbi:MAG TPA: hypothetical protein VFA11_05790 [Acidimicrobiales bacterium]|nr:hypothetical protein [Acidimicrobiales bacterium]
MIDESAAPSRTAEIVTACPDCGQILVRPEDFSGERMLYLHRKWSGCAAETIDLRDSAPDADNGPPTGEMVLGDFPAETPGY